MLEKFHFKSKHAFYEKLLHLNTDKIYRRGKSIGLVFK